MKTIILSILLLASPAFLCGDEPPDPKFVGEHLLGESANPSGQRLVLRELTVSAAEIAARPELQGRHYYRCEFYSSHALTNSATTWDMSVPGKVSVSWSADSTGEISLLDGWLHIRFDTRKKPVWSFERRID